MSGTRRRATLIFVTWSAVVAALGIGAVSTRLPEGLHGTYFESIDWSGEPAHETVDPQPSTGAIEAAWGGQPPNVFSAVWSGSLLVLRGGTYTFRTTSDDGSWVYVDGRLVVDNGGFHSPQATQGQIELARGVHPILIRYVQGGAGYAFTLAWTRNGGAVETMPARALTPEHPRPGRAAAALALGVAFEAALGIWVIGAVPVSVRVWRRASPRMRTWLTSWRRRSWREFLVERAPDVASGPVARAAAGLWPRADAVAAAACAVALAAYFLWYTGGTLREHFSPDDMENMHGYWSPGWGASLRAIVFFWSTFKRPLLALFYLPIYDAAGLTITPYRVVFICLTVVNAVLFAVLCARLVRDRWTTVATLAGWMFHQALFLAYGSNATICDVLCFSCYMLALFLYVNARTAGRGIGTGRLVAIAVLYVLALDAKEMAVTLPLVIALLELLVFRRRGQRADARVVGLVLVTGVLTAVYVVGKFSGPYAAARNPAFHPTLSFAVWARSLAWYTSQLLYTTGEPVSPATAMTVWGTALALALAVRSRLAAFAVLYALVALLPVSFIDLRQGYVWLIPIVGPAIYVAAVLRATAGRLPVVRWAVPLLIAWMLFPPEEIQRQQHGLLGAQKVTWSFLGSVRASGLALPRGSSVLVRDDPFGGNYDAVFILRLYFNDRGLRVAFVPSGTSEVKGSLLPAYDTVLRVTNERLIREPAR